MTKRVAIVGAGPSGMLTLKALKPLAESGAIEMIAFEKQPRWGGLWNCLDEREKDQWGDEVHGSMYRNLWTNNPIECWELHDAPFSGNIPSFPPKEPVFQYLSKYIKTNGLDKYMQLNTKIENVQFDKNTDMFSVTYRNFGAGESKTESFDYLVVCTGHFSTPHDPHFDGEETFPGDVIHSHVFRDGAEFKGQRVLTIGGSFSSEDIALQCWKFGAEQVTLSQRGDPTGFLWPKGVTEKPILTKISGSKVTFADGSEAELDAIIKCTGYLHSFPFLAEELRLVTDNNFHPPLYKQIVFPDNSSLFYVGMQNEAYTFPMFDLQGLFIAKVLAGEFQLPSKSEMLQEIARGISRMTEIKDLFDAVDFQTEYLKELSTITEGPSYDAAHLFKAWIQSRNEDIVGYRAKSYKSIHTGRVAPEGPNWADELDSTKLKFTF